MPASRVVAGTAAESEHGAGEKQKPSDQPRSKVRRHWRRAYRVAYLIVHDHAAAEDIAQEAFVSAIRTLHRFDRARPLAPWLGRIVANRAIDWTRARTARREVDHVALPEPAAPAELAAGYSDELLEALRTLSPEHRRRAAQPRLPRARGLVLLGVRRTGVGVITGTRDPGGRPAGSG